MTTTNPLLAGLGIPSFHNITAEHVTPAIDSILTKLIADLEKLEKNYALTWAGLVEPLMAIGEELRQVWGPVMHLSGVRNSSALRDAIAATQPKVVDFSLRLSQSQAIYQGLKALQAAPSYSTFDRAQKRIVELALIQAEHSGIGLTGAFQERFNTLSKEQSEITTDFSNHVLDAVKAFEMILVDPADIAGLHPSHLGLYAAQYQTRTKNAATAEAGPWLVTLDGPSYIAFMENAKSSVLREKLYRAFVAKASSGEFDNAPLITKILANRKEKAKLLGFDSYAALSLSEKMAGDVSKVYSLLSELKAASYAPAKAELAEITAFANSNGNASALYPWDLPYWAKRLEEERYAYTEEELRPYFPLEQVLSGLFALVQDLFAIRVEAADGQAPVWHPQVRYFKIFDQNNEHIASFFLDPYSRPEDKRGGAWMNDCVPRTVQNARLVHVPVAYLICNSSRPVNDKPCLMTFSEIRTLFHEFGHGLQHMLTQVNYLDVAGINGVEWDAVELPSQFMENWCYERDTLRRISCHIETKEVLPDAFIDKLNRAKNYRAAQMMLRQLQFALVDLALHHDFDPHGTQTVFDLQREIAKETSVIAPIDEDYFLCSFSHIFAGGYAAGYYSYKWAEVLSADAFEAFLEVGLENKSRICEVGRKFRDTVLALGGSRPAKEVFELFRGRPSSSTALLKHSGLA